MAAFFPGVGRPEYLTPDQRQMYLSQLGLVLFYRDRAVLQGQFAQYGDEAIAELLQSDAGPPGAKTLQRLRAWSRFIRQYDLGGGIEPDAAAEFLHALDRKRVPAWALNIAPLDEIRDAGGGE